jgi:hypothetical protein
MKRSTIIVAVVFAALLVAVITLNDRPVQRGAEHLSLSTIDPEGLDGLSISDGETSLELKRDGQSWRLPNGHLADPDMIKRAVEGLSKIDTTDVVSSSEERRSNYGVDKESGITVVATEKGDKVAELVIGNPGQGGTYVRQVGKDPVFEAQGSLRHLFPTDEKRWLKLRLADGALDDAVQVDIALASGDRYTIVPAPTKENEWALKDPSRLPEGFRFDGPGARSLANNVIAMRAKEIVEDPVEAEATGLDADHDSFTIVSPAGTTTFHLGASAEAGDVYARVDGVDALFLVPSFRARNVRKPMLELRDLRLMSLDPEAATALSLKDKSTSYRFVKDSGGEWTIDSNGAQPPQDFEFDPAAVASMARRLTGVRATALADGVSADRAGLGRPAVAVTVTLNDGSTAELAFGAKTKDSEDKTAYYARGNADDKVYVVAEPQLSSFTRGWDAFKYVPPPQSMGRNPFGNMDPETLKNLPPDVRESLMKQMQEQQQKQRLLEQIQRQQQGG